MTPQSVPRVEVELRSSRTCFLSGGPDFNFVLLLTLRNSEVPILFLVNGFQNIAALKSVNSSRIVQCTEHGSGEQQDVLRPKSKPSFLKLEPNRGGYITFTTSATPKSYELAFVKSSLAPDTKYNLRVRFNPLVSVTHWPLEAEDLLNALSSGSTNLDTSIHIPTPSATHIPWQVIDSSSNSITFQTRSSPPFKTPKASVSLSAAALFSMSNIFPFLFTLTFTTVDAPGPITVLAERYDLQASNTDIEILDAGTRSRVWPDLIDNGNCDGPWRKEDFLRIDGHYTETRQLDPTRNHSDLKALQIGKAYILRVLPGKWPWWTEDSIDEVMTYAGERGGFGLEKTDAVKWIDAPEAKFVVCE